MPPSRRESKSPLVVERRALIRSRAAIVVEMVVVLLVIVRRGEGSTSGGVLGQESRAGPGSRRGSQKRLARSLREKQKKKYPNTPVREGWGLVGVSSFSWFLSAHERKEMLISKRSSVSVDGARGLLVCFACTGGPAE